MRHFFARRTPSPEEAEELTQETFLRVYRGRGEFRGETDFVSWLFCIATNLFRNRQRDRAAGKRHSWGHPRDVLADLAQERAQLDRGTPDEAPGPLVDLLSRERIRLVARALRELPEQMRRCAVLRYHHGCAYQEIADRLGIAVDTVKAHLYQARRKLKASLAPHFDLAEEEDEP